MQVTGLTAGRRPAFAMGNASIIEALNKWLCIMEYLKVASKIQDGHMMTHDGQPLGFEYSMTYPNLERLIFIPQVIHSNRIYLCVS